MEQNTPAVLGPVERQVRPGAEARWYCLSREGMATLCTDEEDAKEVAAESFVLYPQNGPYRAVQMVDSAHVTDLLAALRQCARQAEALKRECGSDPESAQAVRNGQYQAISTAAHIALGTIKGPRPSEAVATVTECEACFTPDVCQLRGTCDHYSAERLRIAKGRP